MGPHLQIEHRKKSEQKKKLKMSEIKNTKEVYQEQAVPIEEPTVDQTPTEGISTEKPGFWNVAKKICLGATIVFLLLRVIQYHKTNSD